MLQLSVKINLAHSLKLHAMVLTWKDAILKMVFSTPTDNLRFDFRA